MELLEDDLDLEDFLRRKRNADYTKVLQASPEEISSIGELLYPHDTETSATKNSEQEFSSLGEILYPNDFETNKVNEDEEDVRDYSVEPMENVENDFLGQSSPMEHNHLGSKERVSVFQFFELDSTLTDYLLNL